MVDLRRGVWLLGFLILAMVLAQGNVTLSLNGKNTLIPGFSQGGKLYMAAKPLAASLGANLSVSGSQATFKRTNASASVPILSKGGTGYVVALDVAKGLGFTASVSGTTLTAKSPADSGQPAVQGTQQLAGGVGEIGKTYTLRPGADDALNLTINKIEYVGGHFILEDSDAYRSDAKYAVVYVTVQNPVSNQEVPANHLSMSGVDSNDKTIGNAEWYDLKSRKMVFNSLKPGQKLEMFSFFPLDDKASLPKLIVQNGDKVIRFDLKGKVASLPAPLVDPASDGSVIPEKLIGTAGAAYPGLAFDLIVDSFGFSDQKIGDVEVPEGGKLLVANFTVKGTGPIQQSVGSYNTGATVTDVDGQAVGFAAVLLASRDAEFNASLTNGSKSSGRLIFPLQKDQKPAQMSVQMAGARWVVFDLSSLK